MSRLNKPRQGYLLGDIVDFFTDTYDEYKGIVDTAVGVGKAYLDYKDAKRRNELEEAAYSDYMAAAEAAGQQAQAAIDLNLTPMTVANLPTKKADITSFTQATGVKDGGIMKLKDGTADPNAGITALRKVAPEVVAKMGFNKGGGPGIEALRKVRPDVVKRMGFAEGMNEEMIEEISYEPGKYSDDEIEAYENYRYEMNEQRPGFPIMEIEDFLKFFYSPYSKKDEDRDMDMEMVETKDMGITTLRKGGRAGYQEGIGPIEEVDISINDSLLGSPDYQGGTTTSDVINQKETSSNNIQEMASSFLTTGMDTNEALETAMMITKASEQVDFDQNLVQTLIQNGATVEEALTQAIQIAKGANVSKMKTGGRVKKVGGGIMDMGGMEKDYRFTGGFVPIGEYERKDDVPARLSKNEFVMTADAVRAAGGGSIQKGAKRMYDTMKNLEAKPSAKRMTA
tara:strand:- start:103 stop:1464 length:1362 start_codon:yes stop_codon:yes gene_type:complete